MYTHAWALVMSSHQRAGFFSHIIHNASPANETVWTDNFVICSERWYDVRRALIAIGAVVMVERWASPSLREQVVTTSLGFVFLLMPSRQGLVKSLLPGPSAVQVEMGKL